MTPLVQPGSKTSRGGRDRAFLWQRGKMIDLGVVPGDRPGRRKLPYQGRLYRAVLWTPRTSS